MQNKPKIQNWFETWFDSPYYHVLYKDRDQKEANRFLTALFSEINPPNGARILDLACGKGRHALFLHQLGFDVTGIDLSSASIAAAKKHETKGLRFLTGDMRHGLPHVSFDLVINLFTSFGYFDSISDNQAVLKAAYRMLNPSGCLIIDYLNSHFVRKNLIPYERVKRHSIEFTIERKIEDQKIFKTINFEAQNQKHRFREQVAAFDLNDFERLLTSAGFFIDRKFGSYSMDPFEVESSDRLIMICKKRPLL